jgi:hypothetical protein|nr:hypothetical protein [Candidatus Acidoferrales bacterium]
MRTHPIHIRRFRIPSLVFVTLIATAILAYSAPTESFLRGRTKTSDAAATPQNSGNRVAQVSSDQPLWKLDLHPMGYPAENHLLQWQRGLGSFDTVNFLSDNVVAETFVTQEPDAGLQRRKDPNRARPYKLHAIFFDATTGAVVKTLEWLGDDVKMGIFPRYDGSFVFFSAEHLILYSTDWKPEKEAVLPRFQDANASLKEIAESPSGKTLEVRIRLGQSLACLWIYTDTFKTERTSCSILLPFTISDDGVASTITPDTFTFSGENRQARPGTEKEHRPHPNNLAEYAKVELDLQRGDLKGILCDTTIVSSCGSPTFISNTMIVVHGDYFLGLMDISGLPGGGKSKLEFEKTFIRPVGRKSSPDLDYYWIAGLGRPVHSSANGQRFAVAVNAPRKTERPETVDALVPQRLPSIDPSYVDVFDLPSGQRQRMPSPDPQCDTIDAPCDWWIYRLTNVNHQFQHIWGFGLSPNGEKLVIDSGGVIQVYALPPATRPTADTQ